MHRPIAVVGAPSSLGIRPYDDGEARHLDRAPGVLRRRGLVSRLGAVDLGDVIPLPYRDYTMPANRARNEVGIAAYSRDLSRRIVDATEGHRFCLVVGGDCSIVLGCLLGARRRAGGSIGLVYIDGHADFAVPGQSTTGSVSGMTLALASGRGGSPLAALAGHTPLVNSERVALLGRRHATRRLGDDELDASPILDVTDGEFSLHTATDIAAASLAHVVSSETRGFWIHVDVDVLTTAAMAAVDSPEAGGLMPADLVNLLASLVDHPLALGLDVSIYDPALDPDRACARRLVGLLAAALRPSEMAAGPTGAPTDAHDRHPQPSHMRRSSGTR